MALKISFQNAAGELDSRIAATGEEAVEALIDMVRAAGVLLAGDRITVEHPDED